MDGQALEALIAECEKLVDTRVNAVKGGSIASFEEYKEICGQIRGLLLAVETAKSLLRNLSDD